MSPQLQFELTADGTKVTGTFTALSKVAVEGEFKDGVLSMTSKVRVEGHRASLAFRARLQPDGSLAGTVNPQETGEFEWYATRKAGGA